MKRFSNLAVYFILTLIPFFSSCNDKNIDITIDKNLRINASKIIIEPFDTIILSLNLSKEEIEMNYDSVFWIGDGQASSPMWSSLDSIVLINNRYFALKKYVTDYRIGIHKVYIKTYKDNKASYSDSIEFEVCKPTGNFLSLKWNLKKDEFLYFTPNLTQKRQNFGTYLELIKSFDSDNYPTARLEFWGWAFSSNSDNSGEINLENLYNTREKRKSIRQLYHNYITELYGQSTFLYEDSISQTPLREEYEKRFKYKIGSEAPNVDYPLEIWDTPTAHIALISLGNDDYMNLNWYKVIAEPRKF